MKTHTVSFDAASLLRQVLQELPDAVIVVNRFCIAGYEGNGKLKTLSHLYGEMQTINLKDYNVFAEDLDRSIFKLASKNDEHSHIIRIYDTLKITLSPDTTLAQ